ncbi:class I SAM-dependent methyltransferase [Pseudalkalibacillus salsuginis]|uniref:class I SAM-dependent methyltransferase n=1 Tax=Pseudalkalibacillus salsuginis TaxID=2910972 RepID=UPI001F293E78|nr:methyltransferase domain-containing protein [Pseudalkalibacillus salsuginis]MCF6409172.1 class I SAM-dependent methyltransferase [Pseudalkalibacillus salsuginis]
MRNFSKRPVSRQFGFDRGQPIDRYFIERFLKEKKHFIKGKVLEIGENRYTEQFGDQIERSDVFDIDRYPGVTITGNLETGENVPDSEYDCFILTQVIHIIYDFKQALRNALKTLKPGGVLLVTFPGLSQSCKTKEYGDYWRFTRMAIERFFYEIETVGEMAIETYGNLGIAQAFLEGRAVHEIPRSLFAYNDPRYEVIHMAAITKKDPYSHSSGEEHE